MSIQLLLTPAQKRKMQRDAEILKRWKQLTANPASSKEEIVRVICSEFGCSRSVIYELRKRAGLV